MQSISFILVAAALLSGCAPTSPPDAPALFEVDLGRASREAADLIEELQQAVADAPEDAEASGTLGLALEANALPQAAIRAYARAEELAPGDPRWSYLGAVVTAQTGDLERALTALDRSLALDASYIPGQLYRGGWLLDLGRVDEALEAYEQVAIQQPGNLHAAYGLVRARLRRGEPAEALAILDGVAPRRREDPYYQRLLSQASRAAGDAEAARAAAERGRSGEAPGWPDPRRAAMADYARGFGADMQRADALLVAGAWQEAATIYERAREGNPDEPALLANLALTYRNLGRLDESLAVLREGLEHDPGHVMLRVNLGATHEARGELDQALRELDRAIEIDPNSSRAHQRRGMLLLYRLGRVEDAVTALQRSETLDGSDPLTHHHLGIALGEAERYAEANEQLELALTLAPDRLETMLPLAFFRMESGQLDEADAVLRRAQAMHPDAGEIVRMRERLESKRSEAR